jgi:hypothetical protein
MYAVPFVSPVTTAAAAEDVPSVKVDHVDPELLLNCTT